MGDSAPLHTVRGKEPMGMSFPNLLDGGIDLAQPPAMGGGATSLPLADGGVRTRVHIDGSVWVGASLSETNILFGSQIK
jgi:hypothetical protein